MTLTSTSSGRSSRGKGWQSGLHRCLGVINLQCAAGSSSASTQLAFARLADRHVQLGIFATCPAEAA